MAYNLCTAFINLTYTTNLLVITNDFTDASNKGKINNNICCSFEEFDVLIKVFTVAIYFSLIIKGGDKTKVKLSKQTVTPFIWNSEWPLLFSAPRNLGKSLQHLLHCFETNNYLKLFTKSMKWSPSEYSEF